MSGSIFAPTLIYNFSWLYFDFLASISLQIKTHSKCVILGLAPDWLWLRFASCDFYYSSDCIAQVFFGGLDFKYHRELVFSCESPDAHTRFSIPTPTAAIFAQKLAPEMSTNCIITLVKSTLLKDALVKLDSVKKFSPAKVNLNQSVFSKEVSMACTFEKLAPEKLVLEKIDRLMFKFSNILSLNCA